MRIWSCALLLAALITHSAGAQVTRNTKQRIEASYRRESAALTKENAAGVMVHYAREYQYFGPKGVRYRVPQVQAILSQMFSAMRGIRSTTSILSWKATGKTLKTRVRERLEGTFTDKRTKRASKLVVVEERDDYWRPAGKSWVKWRSRSIKQRETMNGRPVRR
jgi:hypothetical protein